jgi:hypothetical protein
MKPTPRQLPYHIAECGARCLVRQTSPYEFEWSCSCGEAGVISWAHAQPPPLFEVDRTLLFNEEAQK